MFVLLLSACGGDETGAILEASPDASGSNGTTGSEGSAGSSASGGSGGGTSDRVVRPRTNHRDPFRWRRIARLRDRPACARPTSPLVATPPVAGPDAFKCSGIGVQVLSESPLKSFRNERSSGFGIRTKLLNANPAPNSRHSTRTRRNDRGRGTWNSSFRNAQQDLGVVHASKRHVG
jgi:hypothetical protein